MRVTERGDRKTTEEVEIPLPRRVPQFRTGTTLEHHGWWAENRKERTSVETSGFGKRML
jgi:hypothetical protein